jgi:hypothetical protein
VTPPAAPANGAAPSESAAPVAVAAPGGGSAVATPSAASAPAAAPAPAAPAEVRPAIASPAAAARGPSQAAFAFGVAKEVTKELFPLRTVLLVAAFAVVLWLILRAVGS